MSDKTSKAQAHVLNLIQKTQNELVKLLENWLKKAERDKNYKKAGDFRKLLKVMETSPQSLKAVTGDQNRIAEITRMLKERGVQFSTIKDNDPKLDTLIVKNKDLEQVLQCNAALNIKAMEREAKEAEAQREKEKQEQGDSASNEDPANKDGGSTDLKGDEELPLPNVSGRKKSAERDKVDHKKKVKDGNDLNDDSPSLEDEDKSDTEVSDDEIGYTDEVETEILEDETSSIDSPEQNYENSESDFAEEDHSIESEIEEEEGDFSPVEDHSDEIVNEAVSTEDTQYSELTNQTESPFQEDELSTVEEVESSAQTEQSFNESSENNIVSDSQMFDETLYESPMYEEPIISEQIHTEDQQIDSSYTQETERVDSSSQNNLDDTQQSLFATNETTGKFSTTETSNFVNQTDPLFKESSDYNTIPNTPTDDGLTSNSLQNTFEQTHKESHSFETPQGQGQNQSADFAKPANTDNFYHTENTVDSSSQASQNSDDLFVDRSGGYDNITVTQPFAPLDRDLSHQAIGKATMDITGAKDELKETGTAKGARQYQAMGINDLANSMTWIGQKQVLIDSYKEVQSILGKDGIAQLNSIMAGENVNANILADINPETLTSKELYAGLSGMNQALSRMRLVHTDASSHTFQVEQGYMLKKDRALGKPATPIGKMLDGKEASYETAYNFALSRIKINLSTPGKEISEAEARAALDKLIKAGKKSTMATTAFTRMHGAPIRFLFTATRRATQDDGTFQTFQKVRTTQTVVKQSVRGLSAARNILLDRKIYHLGLKQSKLNSKIGLLREKAVSDPLAKQQYDALVQKLTNTKLELNAKEIERQIRHGALPDPLKENAKAIGNKLIKKADQKLPGKALRRGAIKLKKKAGIIGKGVKNTAGALNTAFSKTAVGKAAGMVVTVAGKAGWAIQAVSSVAHAIMRWLMMIALKGLAFFLVGYTIFSLAVAIIISSLFLALGFFISSDEGVDQQAVFKRVYEELADQEVKWIQNMLSSGYDSMSPPRVVDTFVTDDTTFGEGGTIASESDGTGVPTANDATPPALLTVQEGLNLPPIQASKEDLENFACLISHEAEGEGPVGQLAVAEVIINRLNSNNADFAHCKTLSDVVFDHKYGEQFTGMQGVIKQRVDGDGNTIYKDRNGRTFKVNSTIRYIAQHVADGTLRLFNNPNVLYFRGNISDSNRGNFNKSSWYARIKPPRSTSSTSGHSFYYYPAGSSNAVSASLTVVDSSNFGGLGDVSTFSAEDYITGVMGAEFNSSSGRTKGPMPWAEAPTDAYKWIDILDGDQIVSFTNQDGTYGYFSNIKEIMSMASVASNVSDDVEENFEKEEVSAFDAIGSLFTNAFSFATDTVSGWVSKLPGIGSIKTKMEEDKLVEAYMSYCQPLFDLSHQQMSSGMSMTILPTKRTANTDGDVDTDEGMTMCTGNESQSSPATDEHHGYGCMHYDGFAYRYDNVDKLYYNQEYSALADKEAALYGDNPTFSYNDIYTKDSYKEQVEPASMLLDDTSHKDDVCVAPGSDAEAFAKAYEHNPGCWSVGEIETDIEDEGLDLYESYRYSRVLDDDDENEEDAEEPENSKEEVLKSTDSNTQGSRLADMSYIDDLYPGNEGYVIYSTDGGKTYTVKVQVNSWDEGDEDDSDWKYEMAYVPFRHCCQSKHTGYYCGGHFSLNITGMVYTFTEAERKTDHNSYEDRGVESGHEFKTTNLWSSILSIGGKAIDEAAVRSAKDLFDIDNAITHKKGSYADSFAKQGWTYDNMDSAVMLTYDDWEDLYGIEEIDLNKIISEWIATVGTRLLCGTNVTLTDAQMLEYLHGAEEILSDTDPSKKTRIDALTTALYYVGKIYYTQDHRGALFDGKVGVGNRGDDCSSYASGVWKGVLQDKYTCQSMSSTFRRYIHKFTDGQCKPGDILLSLPNGLGTSGSNHALIYLGKQNGRELVVQEGGGDGNGNVTVTDKTGRGYLEKCYYIDMNALMGLPDNDPNYHYSSTLETSFGSHKGATFNLTEDELVQIASLCQQEQDGAAGAAAEASLMANLWESKGKSNGSLYNYIRNSGWFANAAKHMDKRAASKAEIASVKDVLVNGNRVLGPNVTEHDCFSDIIYVSFSGEKQDVSSNKKDKASYQKGKTIIVNRYGSVYRFDSFPGTDDPFGEKLGEGNDRKHFSSILPEWVLSYRYK